MKKGLIGIFVLIGCGLMALDCRTQEEGTAPESVGNSSDAFGPGQENSAVPAFPETKEESMVASVNGKRISRSELDRATDILFTRHRDQIPPDQVGRARSALEKQALEGLISQSLLLQEAEREGIQPDKQAVTTRLKEVSQNFSNPQEYQQFLDALSLSEEAFRQEIAGNLKVESLLEKNLADVKKVSSDEADEFYRDHPEQFKMPEKVRASHILMSVDAGDSDEERAQRRGELSRLRTEIEGGADFAQMANQHSDCPSSSRGGDLGHFERGKMVKAFEDAAFQMKVGEVSQIVETQFGYHLIRLTDHQEARTVPLGKVRGDVEAYLNKQNREKAVGDYLVKLRDTAKIEYAEGPNP